MILHKAGKYFTNSKNCLLIIFILALALRILPVLTINEEDNYLGLDAGEYNEIATSLLHGKGFSWGQYRNEIASFIPLKTHPGQPTSWREPLYPLFIASVYFVFGENLNSVRVAQAIIGSLLCLLIFLIAKEIFGTKIGLISAFLTAIYPSFISHLYFGGPNFILSENLFIFVLAIAILFLVKFIKKPSLLNACFPGLFLGLATLTKSVFIFFPLAFGLFFFFLNREKLSKKIVSISFLLFCYVLILTPWTIRNYYIHHDFILITTRGGVVFRAGNNILARGSFVPNLESKKFYGLSENQMSKAMFRDGLIFLKTNPRRLIAKLFFRKTVSYWNPFDLRFNFQYSVILILSMLGTFHFFKKERFQVILLMLIFLYSTFITMMTLGDVRFRYPIEPYLIILAAAGLYALFVSRPNKAFPICVLLFILAVNGVLYIYSDKFLALSRLLFEKFSLR